MSGIDQNLNRAGSTDTDDTGSEDEDKSDTFPGSRPMPLHIVANRRRSNELIEAQGGEESPRRTSDHSLTMS